MNFEQNGLLFAGGEDRNITAWDTNSGKLAYCIEDAHSTRVKGIVVLTRNDGDVNDPCLLASASSNGVIRVWDVRMAVKEKPNPLAEVNTKSRLTCLAGSSLKCECCACMINAFFPVERILLFYVNAYAVIFVSLHLFYRKYFLHFLTYGTLGKFVNRKYFFWLKGKYSQF